MVRWNSPRGAIAAEPFGAMSAARSDAGGATGSSTAGVFSTKGSGLEKISGGVNCPFKGVPSTGQKLNFSATASLQFEQNFILTTSSWLWGNSTEFDSVPALPSSL